MKTQSDRRGAELHYVSYGGVLKGHSPATEGWPARDLIGGRTSASDALGAPNHRCARAKFAIISFLVMWYIKYFNARHILVAANERSIGKRRAG